MPVRYPRRGWTALRWRERLHGRPSAVMSPLPAPRESSARRAPTPDEAPWSLTNLRRQAAALVVPSAPEEFPERGRDSVQRQVGHVVALNDDCTAVSAALLQPGVAGPLLDPLHDRLGVSALGYAGEVAAITHRRRDPA